MGKLWMIGLLVIVTTLQECIKESTGPEDGVPSELVGDWYATSFTWTNPSNPQQTINMIAFGGSFMLQIMDDGTFMATMTEPGGVPDIIQGTATFDGNTMTVTEDGETNDLTWILVGGVLTLTDNNESFDFNDDGTDEPAIMTIVLSQTPPGNNSNVPTEAVGTWAANSYMYVNDANSSQTFDAISAGSSFTLMIMSNGSYTATWLDAGSSSPDIDMGTLAFSGNIAVATGTGGEITQFVWMISGNTMTLVFDESYDFDSNGTEESATVTCIMTRQ